MARCAVTALLVAMAPAMAAAQYRKLGEMELRLTGLSASPEVAESVIPKNTPGGVRVVVRAGGTTLSIVDTVRLLGSSVRVEGEMSGPGLREPLSLPVAGAGVEGDPFVLVTPPLPVAGDYRVTNLRLVVNGRPVLDVEPSTVAVKVIDQILVTQVKTRALTLDEIRAKGIVLDSDDYLGFEFTMGFKLDSKAVDLKFPVVFDRQGVAVPQPLMPPAAPVREGIQLPTILPMLLEAEGPSGERESITVTLPSGVVKPVTIPAALVIPGNVGYLKQFFSAQLYVSNGAPVGSSLDVRDIVAHLKMPPGADLELGTADDPLALPELDRDGQVITQPLDAPVRGVGEDGKPDTADDVAVLGPGEQGQAEFLLRGEQEGFHPITFDLSATLLGLPIGPVTVRGKASGGVLVRNPFFNVTFAVPSVVRAGERFRLRATMTNIGKGVGNDVSMTIDQSRLSGLVLVGDATQRIATLAPGDARTLEFEFVSQRTGKVVASYLKFDGAGASGRINFTVAVGERNVPLSPDTLVLPASTEGLPPAVVDAAMRVLGQAWSAANAPAGTLPAGVARPGGQAVVKKALALAEAGLRVTLGQPQAAAVRDLLYDFTISAPVDTGFDQVLRDTSAGRDFAAAIGAALAGPALVAGGAGSYEFESSRVFASAGEFTSVSWEGPSGRLGVSDANGRRASRNTAIAGAEGAVDHALPGAALIPLREGSLLGLIAGARGLPTLEFTAEDAGRAEASFTFPRPDGSFGRVTWSSLLASGARVRVVATDAGDVSAELDAEGDGVYERVENVSVATLPADGPRLIAGAVIGPETLDGAGPWGFDTALVFDRIVDEASAGDVARYTVPENQVRVARRQLSGRLVLAALRLPEGPNVPSRVSVSGLTDARGVVGVDASADLTSRLEAPGAIVSGRVLTADGEPIAGQSVVYAQSLDLQCLNPVGVSGLAAAVTDAQGAYELRYVRQDQCGQAFSLTTRDPRTNAARSQALRVRAAGEAIVADFVMLAAGSVTGVVRDLVGQPVPGARVTVLSQTEPQVGAAATTDALGHYSVTGITVGGVVVRAAKGNGAGSAAGRIDKASLPAVVDVTIDGGSVSVSGTVRKVEDGLTSTAVGAVVTYRVGDLLMGAMVADGLGRYAFSGLPVGPYSIKAQATARDSATVTGVAAAGDTLFRDISVEIPPAAALAWIEGTVVVPGGAPAVGALVSAGGASVLTDAAGFFRVPVLPRTVAQPVTASTRDRRRSGTTSVLVTTAGQVSTGNLITLSGLGAAEFTVVDPAGTPIPSQQVRLLDSRTSACGGTMGVTDALGRIRFEGLPLGAVTAQAVYQGAMVDAARATASVAGDGLTGFAIIRIETRAGSVSGLVLDPTGLPVLGADVDMTSQVFVNDPAVPVCTMQSAVTHRVRTGPDGRFRFSGVHPGRVSVTARQTDFAPTPVSVARDLAPGGSLDLTLSLINTTAGKISGFVYEPDGVTSAGGGVEVTLKGNFPDVVVLTKPSGEFSFAAVVPQGSYTLTARDPITGLVERDSIYARAGTDLRHDIRLKGKALVRVRVENALAVPLSAAYVTLREAEFPSRSFEAVIAPSNQGVVEFPGVFEGPVSVEARDSTARGGRTSITIPAGVSFIEATVRVTTTGTVRGRLLMPDGTPIPNGTVKLLSAGRLIGQLTSAAVDPVGGFEFQFVPAGSFRIEAMDPLSGRTGLAVGAIDTEGEVVTVDVTTQGIGTVRGVVTANGDPSAGATVRITSGSYASVTTTDAAGSYVVDGVPEGRVVVSADEGAGFLKATASGTLTGDGATLVLGISLRDTGSIRGQLLKAGGVDPAGVAAITLRVGGVGGGTFTGSTDDQGGFVFERVPAGLVEIDADLLGSQDFASATVEVEAGVEAAADLVLNGMGNLTVHALDSLGQPVAGRLTVQGGPAKKRYSYVFDLPPSGIAPLPSVLAGPFTVKLQATTGGLTLYGTAAGDLVHDQSLDVDVVLQDSATIGGRVLRADGLTPAYGASVTLEILATHAKSTQQAQADGRFTFRGAALGAVSISVSDPLTGGLAKASATTAQNGEVIDLGDLVLDDSPVQVVSVSPADGATGVALSTPVRVTFSDPLASASGVSLKKGTSTLSASGALSDGGRVVMFNVALPSASEVTVQATTSVTDILGRRLAQAFSSRFVTQDLTPPAVASIVPASGAIQVASDGTVSVTFSEALDAAADLSTVIQLAQESPTVAIPGAVSATAANVLTFSPAAALPINARFKVTVNGARDLSGNVQTTAFTATFKTTDTVPPVLTLNAPAAGAWVKTRRPSISIALSDALSGVDATSGALTIDGSPVAAAHSSSSISYTPSTDLTEGAHALAATATDLVGNLGTRSATFSVDATAPDPAVITGGVTEGGTVAGTIVLTATSFDGVSGLAKIEVLEGATVRATLLPPGFSASFNALTLAAGPHSFTARGTDVAGNVSAPGAAITFIVDDHTAPSVLSVSPASAAVQVAAAASISVTFNETLSPSAALPGVVTVLQESPATPIPGAVELTAPDTLTFTPITPLPLDARFRVTVNGARDLAGNVQVAAFTSTFKTVDTQPPTLTLSSPASGSWVRTTRASVSITLSDLLSGVAATSGTLMIDGVAVAATRSASALSFTPTSDLAEGGHSLSASVADIVGNVGSLTATFSVDVTAPQDVAITAPAAGQALRGLVTFTAVATDVVAGLERIEIRTGSSGALAVLTAPAFTGTVNAALLTEGEYGFFARAVDRAGNVADSPAVLMTVPFATIRGTVVASDGSTPVPGVLVSAAGNEATTDLTGAYRLEGVAAGSVPVHFVFQGSTQTANISVARGAEVEVNRTLSQIHVNRVFVVEAGTSAPMAGVHVTTCAEAPPQRCAAQSITGATGQVTYLGLPTGVPEDAGLHQVVARTADGVEQTQSMFLSPASPGSVTFAFELPGDVRGVVRLTGGNPVAGVTVSIQDGARFESTQTGSDGSYVFHRWGGRHVVALASDSLGITQTAAEADVPVGSEVAVDLTLPAAVLNLSVESAAGQRLAREAVFVAIAGPFFRVILTDASGEIRLVVPPRFVRVTVENSLNAAAEISLVAGQTENVNLVAGSHPIPEPIGQYRVFESGGDIPTAEFGLGSGVPPSLAVPVRTVAVGQVAESLATFEVFPMGPVYYHRKTFVPAEGSFARSLTVFTNPTDLPVSINPRAEFGTNDIAGREGAVTISGNYSVVYGDATIECPEDCRVASQITIPPHGRRALMLFTSVYTDLLPALLDLSAPLALSELSNEERELIDNFDVPLPGFIEGAALSADGAVLAGARVMVVLGETIVAEGVSGVNGAFSIPFSGAPGNYRIVIALDGQLYEAALLFTGSGGHSLGPIRAMDPRERGAARIVVEDGAGAPVAGLAVSARSARFMGLDPSVPGSTDASGSALVEGLFPGLNRIETPLGVAYARVVAGREVTVRLRRGSGPASVSGLVTLGGQPVAGAVVVGKVWDPVAADTLVAVRATTGLDGRYVLEGVRPAEWVSIEAWDPEAYRPASLGVWTADGVAEALPIELAGDASIGSVLVRTLRESDGLPLAGARVILEPNGWPFAISLLTDAQGEGRVTGLPAGYIVTATLAGSSGGSVLIEATQEALLEVSVEDRTIEGTALSVVGEALAGARVMVALGDSIVAEAVAGPNGAFSLPFIGAAGSYRIVIALGEQFYEGSVVIGGAGTYSLGSFHALDTTARGSARIVVEDATGASVADLAVSARSARFLGLDPLIAASTDASGSALIEGLIPGLNRIETPLGVAYARVVAGREAVVRLRRGSSTASVSGIVTLAGLPVAGAVVVGSQWDPETSTNVVVARATTGLDGRYVLEGVKPWEGLNYQGWDPDAYRLMDSGVWVDVEAADGRYEAFPLELTTDDLVGSVRVRAVRESGGSPLAGAHVVLESWPFSVDITLDAQGEARVEGLSADYYVTARIAGADGVGAETVLTQAMQEVLLVLPVGDRTLLPVSLSGYLVGGDLVSERPNDCYPFCAQGSVSGDGIYEPSIAAASAAKSPDGRELTMTFGGGPVRVVRRVYVPADGSFARIVDTIENTGAEVVPLSHTFAGASYANDTSETISEVLGDGVIDASDAAFVLQSSAAIAEATGFAVRSPNSLAPSLTISDEGFGLRAYFSWDLVLAPGEKASFMTFTVFERGALASTVPGRIEALRDLTDPEALHGLSAAERALIVNWILQ